MVQLASNAGETYAKQAAASGLTSIVWGFICITYDYYDMNNWLFPFIEGFSLKAILTTAAVGTGLILFLGIWAAMPHDTRIPEQRLN